ncbi:MAG: hypothetical protein CBD16_10025, partial [Betaproteobacteria bacterium TMED156]
MAENSDLKVGWLVSNLKTNDFEELFNTELASSRMRAGVCISGCQKADITVYPLNFRQADHNPNLVFMAKYVPDSNTGQYLDDSGKRWAFWLKKIKKLHSKKGKLILDYTDNHFVNPGIVGDFYRKIKPMVHALVLPSDRMKSNVAASWDKETYVIPEPVEVDFIEPGKRQLDVSTALWFGHITNLGWLLEFIQTEIHKAPPRRLIILVNNNPVDAVKQAAKNAPKGMEISLAKWTVDTMRKASKISHYSIIPSNKDDPRKSGVSPGRLLTSLAMGLPVIASPLDSYMPFKEYFSLIGTDEGLNLMKNPLGRE